MVIDRHCFQLGCAGILSLSVGCASVLGTDDLFAEGGAGGTSTSTDKAATGTNTGTNTGASGSMATGTADTSTTGGSTGSNGGCADITVTVVADMKVDVVGGGGGDFDFDEGTHTLCLPLGSLTLRARCDGGGSDDVGATWAGVQCNEGNQGTRCTFTVSGAQSIDVTFAPGASCS